MQAENSDIFHPDPEKRKGFFLWLGRAILLLILLTFFLVAAIHLPPVQRWGVNKLTTSLSRDLNTKVSIEGFTLHPVSDLTLQNVFIGSPAHPADTLIYAERLSVDYKRIWDILSRRATIIQVGINNGLLNIHKVAGDSLTNLDVALLKLLPPANPEKGPFILDLNSLNATSLAVRVDDESNGTLMNMNFKRIDVELDTLDITGKYISIKDLDLDEPRFYIVNRLPMADSTTVVAASSKAWSFDVTHWQLKDGKIAIDNRTKPQTFYRNEKGIDYAHMILDDVDMVMDSLIIRGWDFKAKEIDIHARHSNGFEIQKLAANRASVSKDGIILERLRIKTPDTDIYNSVSLLFSGYTDFKNFADSVQLDIPDAKFRLHIDDLLAIAPGLERVDFFTHNIQKDIELQGAVHGYVNRLKILNMNMSLGDLGLTGDFRSKDLAVTGEQLLNLDLKNSNFSAAGLKDVFPGMKVPLMLNKLGQISFTGKFDGYPDDFKALGIFNTELGSVSLDMNLNTVRGIVEGKYSGILALQDFDLGRFTGQEDLGKVTMSGRVIEGKGLSSESLYADITAQLTSLEFKGKIYKNARVDGEINGKIFNGTLDINDPNIDMHFEGYADFRDSLPRLDFISRIDNLHFKELGLSKESISLKGIFDVDLVAGRPDEVSGRLNGEQVVLTRDTTRYLLDTISLLAFIDTVSGDRSYQIKSGVISGTINGIFDPATLPNQLQHYLHEHYPSSIEAPKKTLFTRPDHRISWNLKIHDSEKWFDLAGVKSLRLKNASTSGRLNLDEQQSTGTIDIPELHFGNINAYGTTIAFSETSGQMEIDMELIAADVNEGFFFEDVLIRGMATDDSVRFNFKTDDLADIINELDLDIAADPEDGVWAISFNPRRLVMFGDDWKVPAGNKVEIKKNEFTLENFELVSSDQKIILDDINHKGLEAYISGFNISYLNELWVNDKFDFTGLYTLDLEVDNLYDIQQMKTVLSMPALKINNVPYGKWVLNAKMNDPRDSVRIDLVMQHNETSLIAEGAYLPPLKSIPKDQQNFLRLDIKATEFPLDFLEFFLGGNIRDTEGSVDVTLNLSGKTNKLDPNGKGKVYNGSTVIDYLGAAYSFHDQSFTITETMIDLSGTTLYDVLGNTAVVEGGITHRYLRNLGLNATLSSDKILGLDVTAEENNVFYGRGIGSVLANFSGTVANPTMQITTTTAEGTHIYIPLTSAAESSDRDFVVFLENGLVPAATTTQINLGGINLTINMTITQDAIVEIIFDENTGEVLRGIGDGDLQLSMTRTGNFSMYGNYVIEKGGYLFTNFRVVRKPFELLQGGQINWDGDPYNATLDVQAKYKGLTASVYTLIQEFIPDVETQGDLIEKAKERTEVDLTMKLTGSLLHPDIGFDIGFPNLTGTIKGYADNKLNALKTNENAMLEQVVGLLLTRSFWPAGSGVGSVLFSPGLIDNTLSELISATLSGYLSGIVGNLVTQGDFLTGIDFKVNLDLPITSGGILNSGGEITDQGTTEVEISLPLEFFNDKLSIEVGGNYVTGATLYAVSEYFAGDVTFEYQISKDRRLKIRAYNRNNYTVEGRKNKIGLGLAYRREYDSFPDFLGKKKNKKSSPQPEPKDHL